MRKEKSHPTLTSNMPHETRPLNPSFAVIACERQEILSSDSFCANLRGPGRLLLNSRTSKLLTRFHNYHSSGKNVFLPSNQKMCRSICHPAKECSCWGSNPGSSLCERDVIPLDHTSHDAKFCRRPYSTQRNQSWTPHPFDRRSPLPLMFTGELEEALRAKSSLA